jgi:hypothetical protein
MTADASPGGGQLRLTPARGRLLEDTDGDPTREARRELARLRPV